MSDSATATPAGSDQPLGRRLGVVRDYDQLHAIFRDRADELNVSRLSLDELAGLPTGYVGKLLAPTQLRGCGRISLGALLGALGLALVVVEDRAALDRVKHRLTPRALNAPFSRQRRGLAPHGTAAITESA